MITVKIQGDPNTYQFPDDTPEEVIKNALFGKQEGPTTPELAHMVSHPTTYIPEPSEPAPPRAAPPPPTEQQKQEKENRLWATMEQYGITRKMAEELAGPTTPGGHLAAFTARPMEATKLAMGGWPLPVGEALKTTRSIVRKIGESAAAREYVPKTSKELAQVIRDLGIAEAEIKSTILPPRPGALSRELKLAKEWAEPPPKPAEIFAPAEERGVPRYKLMKEGETWKEKYEVPKSEALSEKGVAAEMGEGVTPPAGLSRYTGYPETPRSYPGAVRIIGEGVDPLAKAFAKPAFARTADDLLAIRETRGALGGEAGAAEVGYHYAPKKLGELHGARVPGETQWYSKEVRDLMEAGIAHPEHPYIPMLNVYGPGATPETIVTHGGKIRHKVQYELRDLYNLNKDPRGFFSMAKKIVRQSETPGDLPWRTNIIANLAEDNGFKGLIAGNTRYLFGNIPAEVGSVRAGVLPHMAAAGIGAATGGAVAPEGERWQGALIGGGAGLILGAGVLKKILKGAPPPKGMKLLPGGKVEVPPIKEGRLTEPIMKTQAIEELGGPASTEMAAKGIVRDPNKTMTQQIIEYSEANPTMSRKEVFEAWGATEEEFLNNLRSSMTIAGRDMNRMSQFARKLTMTPEEFAIIEKVGKEGRGLDAFMYWWKRADNVRRALLVSQLSTALRNLEVQAGRFGIDILEQGISSVFQKGARAFGATIKDPVGILDGFEASLHLFKKNKATVNKIMALFPEADIETRMLHTYMSDIGPSGGATWSGVDKGLNYIGVANRTQEFIIRRAVFTSKIAKTLENKGLNFKAVMESGEVTEHLTENELTAGIQKALEFTFAEHAGGQAGRSFVNMINSVPGATWILPFPRFLVNSLKFQYQYSPAGLLNLLSKAERSALAEGNMKVLSRATVGAAMLGAAYLMRKSEFAGEKAWEFNIGGRPVDTRPYNPLVGYLIVADIFIRWMDGTLYNLDTKDIMTAVMGGNVRAGAGLYVVDKILDALTTGSTEQRAEGLNNVLKGFGGEVVGGLATPINQVKEFLSGLDDFTIKNKREEPFLGPLRAKIPGWEAGMEPVYSPTREGPRKAAMPAIRQATGFAIGMQKNEAEKELDRLQFTPREISPSTGIPKLDNLIAKEMGPIVEEELIPTLKSNAYQNLTDAEKSEFLMEEIREIRRDVKEWTLANNPEFDEQLEERRIPKRTRIVMKERGELK